jgi:hypothetical protein
VYRKQFFLSKCGMFGIRLSVEIMSTQILEHPTSIPPRHKRIILSYLFSSKSFKVSQYSSSSASSFSSLHTGIKALRIGAGR